jgi:hypothetical protein
MKGAADRRGRTHPEEPTYPILVPLHRSPCARTDIIGIGTQTTTALAETGMETAVRPTPEVIEAWIERVTDKREHATRRPSMVHPLVALNPIPVDSVTRIPITAV